jgi:DNA-binding NarL/FixJ family response regulator
VSAILLSNELMLSSQVLGAARAMGLPVVVAANGAALAEKLAPGCRLVMVELTLPGVDVADVVRLRNELAPQAAIVAFGPHVDEATLAAAQAAGADLVLSRGQFHRQYAELLRQAAGEAEGG